MNEAKPSRRKSGARKLEPIDWHEFANDAVLNGNMSTLYRRPPSEDPTAYASAEALVEIEKRVGANQAPAPTVGPETTVGAAPTVGSEPTADASSPPAPEPRVGLAPTVGPELTSSATPFMLEPTVGSAPTVGSKPTADASPFTPEPTVGSDPTVGLGPAATNRRSTVGSIPAVGTQPTASGEPTVGMESPVRPIETTTSGKPTVGSPPTVGSAGTAPITRPTAGSRPTVGFEPTVAAGPKRRVKPIRVIHDALTLAGQVLYKAMYGSTDSGHSKSCTKGYRQLAAETHLDKDTVRDLISDFKDRGIVRETGTYDPDTRSSKTYEVLSERAVLRMWREAGVTWVTSGRWRPMFCTAQGEPLTLRPTVGPIGKTDRVARDAGRAGQ